MMALLYINARCKQILNFLLTQTKYITTEQIGAEMKVSKRTVYYDICKINLWLEQSELSPLEVIREKGILIPHGEKPLIQNMLRSDEQEQIYIFSPEEQIYLSLHLLGSRVNIVPDAYFESNSKQYIHDLTRTLISDFEKVACIFFEQREELERALFVHLNTSMYRYKFGVQIGNIIGNDILHEYPELCALTRIAAGRLEETIGFPVPDGEIAYLALHFGAFLKISKREDDRLRILIVCVNGISTGNMLKREIQKLLPFAEIVDVRAVVDMVNIQNICDLVISTVKINTVVPVITVHPILTEFDRSSILNHRVVLPKNVTARREQMFRVIKKYVRPEDHEDLRKDLTAFIQGSMEYLEGAETQENDLMSILDVSRIHIYEKADSWQDSIRMAGRCLLDYKSIEKNYLNTIVSQLQYYGPYMFLTRDVILAHAKPEDGVNCLDLSLAVFREPVVYSELRQAKVVMVLAAEDQEKHLKILQDILQLLSGTDFISRIEGCGSAAEIYYLMKELLA